jgi:hypothetical protein
MQPHFLKLILSPCALPRNAVAVVGYVAISLVFAVATQSDYEKQAQFLYCVPLFMISFYNGQKHLVAGALASSVVLAIATFFMYSTPSSSTFVETLLAIFTNVTVGLFALYARRTFLQAK